MFLPSSEIASGTLSGTPATAIGSFSVVQSQHCGACKLLGFKNSNPLPLVPTTGETDTSILFHLSIFLLSLFSSP